MPGKHWLIILTILLVAGLAATAYAQGAGGDAGAPAKKTITTWDTIKSGGLIGALIIVDSIIALTWIIMMFLAVRRDILAPPEILSQIESHFDDEEYEEALHLCEASPCYLTNVIAAGLSKVHLGHAEAKAAMEAAGDEEVTKLNIMLGYLSYMGTVAPMLGLLGTVVGMIGAFNTIANSGGSADAAALSGNIGMAMVTTAEGLYVAIPVQGCYVALRNKIVETSYEIGAIGEELFERFRQTE